MEVKLKEYRVVTTETVTYNKYYTVKAVSDEAAVEVVDLQLTSFMLAVDKGPTNELTRKVVHIYELLGDKDK